MTSVAWAYIHEQVDTEEVNVEASSRWMHMSDPRALLVRGANFKRDITKLHFYPPLPEGMFYQQVHTCRSW